MSISKMLSYLVPHVFLSFIIGFYSHELLLNGFSLWPVIKILVSIFMFIFFVVMHYFILKSKINKITSQDNK